MNIKYQANLFYTSFRMGADAETLNMIKDYQSKITFEDIDFDSIPETDISKLQRNYKKACEELKTALENVEQNMTSNYELTNFIFKLKKLENAENNLSKIQKRVKEKERVTEFFGELDSRKQNEKGVWVDKTPDDLMRERNERLAILNKLYTHHEIDDTEMKNMVVSTRRVYERAVNRCVGYELETTAKKKPNKFKEIFDKLKIKVRKMFKPFDKVEVENVESKYDDALVNENAMQALITASDLIIGTEDVSNPMVERECCKMTSDVFEMIENSKVKGVSQEIRDFSFEVNTKNIENAKGTEHEQEVLNTVLNFGQVLVTDRDGNVKVNNKLEEQKEKYYEYMFNKYGIFDATSGGLPVQRFNDEKIAEQVERVMAEFDSNIKIRNEILSSNARQKMEDLVNDHKAQVE